MHLVNATLRQYADEVGLNVDELRSTLSAKGELYLSSEQVFILDAIAVAKRYSQPPAHAIETTKAYYERNGQLVPVVLDQRDVIAVSEYMRRTGGVMASKALSDKILDRFDTDYLDEFTMDFGHDTIRSAPSEYGSTVVRETAHALACRKGHLAYDPDAASSADISHVMDDRRDRIWAALLAVPVYVKAGRAYRQDLRKNILALFARRHDSEFHAKYGKWFQDASDEERRTVVNAVVSDLASTGMAVSNGISTCTIRKVMDRPDSSVWMELSRLHHGNTERRAD